MKADSRELEPHARLLVNQTLACRDTPQLETEPRLQLNRPASQCAAGHPKVGVRSHRSIWRYRAQVPVDRLNVNVRLVKQVVNVSSNFELRVLAQSRNPG